MAQVPYNDGVPSVAPETRPPDDYQHIRAEPDQFGALIGQGLEKAGKGVEQAGENVFNIVQFQNKTAADDQVNHFDTARNHIATGDPSKTTMGADGKPVPDMGYFGLEGRPALDKREDAIKALNDAREEGRKNLKNPAAQLEYDRQTRRMYTEYETKINSHAEAQYKVWAGGVNQKGALNSLNDFTNHLDNPEEMSHHARDYIDFKVKASQLKFGDDPTINRQVIDQSKRELLEAQTSAVAVRDPAGALRILEKNKNIAGTQYDDMYGKLRVRADQQLGLTEARTAIADTKAASSSRMTAQGYTERLFQIESGGQTGAVTGSNKGLGQFGPREQATYGITDWRDPDQQRRAVSLEAQVNAGSLQGTLGRQPTPGELYLAHQQGLAGATAIINHPDIPAWQAIRPFYSSDRMAKLAISGNAYDQLKGVDPDQISGQTFRDYWISKFEHGRAGQVTLGPGGTAPRQASADLVPGGGQLTPSATPVSFGGGFASPGAPEGAAPAALPVAPLSATAPALPQREEMPPLESVIQKIHDNPKFAGNPAAENYAIAEVERQYRLEHAMSANQERQHKQETAEFKQKSDDTEGDMLKNLYSNKPTVTPQQIVNNPHLTREARERMLTQFEKASPGAHADRTYGPGFFDAYKQVHAPPGDPGRITDVAPLYGMVGPNGPLTIAGVEKLRSEIEARKTPEGDAESSMKKQFFEHVARPKITFTNEELKLRDAPGDENFLKFQAAAFTAYDSGKAAGKTPMQLLDPNSKDYIGHLIENFKPDPTTAFANHIEDKAATEPGFFSKLSNAFENLHGEPGGAAPAPAPIDATKINSMTDLQAAYRAGTIQADQAKKLAEQRGWTRPKPKAENPIDAFHAQRDQAPTQDVNRANLEAANNAMHLTPQEKSLYERHLTNLTGPGGVDNPDGSRSSLFQATVEHEGKFYAIPTVWDGKILFDRNSPDPAAAAVEKVKAIGWDKFPSYKTEEEAEARYQEMHKYMERDTETYLAGRKKNGP